MHCQNFVLLHKAVFTCLPENKLCLQPDLKYCPVSSRKGWLRFPITTSTIMIVCFANCQKTCHFLIKCKVDTR